MFFSAVSACGTTREAVSLRPDIEHPGWFVCQPTGSRPAIPPEYQIDWSKVTTVEQAKVEHEKFVGVLRTREGLVAGYILDLEGKHFACFNNMETLRQYYAGLPKDPKAAPAGHSAATPRDPN